MERPYKYGVTALRRSGVPPEALISHTTVLTAMQKIVGYSKVQPSNRVTLTSKVLKKLRVEIGDLIVFLEDSEGNITIKKAELKPV